VTSGSLAGSRPGWSRALRWRCATTSHQAPSRRGLKTRASRLDVSSMSPTPRMHPLVAPHLQHEGRLLLPSAFARCFHRLLGRGGVTATARWFLSIGVLLLVGVLLSQDLPGDPRDGWRMPGGGLLPVGAVSPAAARALDGPWQIPLCSLRTLGRAAGPLRDSLAWLAGWANRPNSPHARRAKSAGPVVHGPAPSHTGAAWPWKRLPRANYRQHHVADIRGKIAFALLGLSWCSARKSHSFFAIRAPQRGADCQRPFWRFKVGRIPCL